MPRSVEPPPAIQGETPVRPSCGICIIMIVLAAPHGVGDAARLDGGGVIARIVGGVKPDAGDADNIAPERVHDEKTFGKIMKTQNGKIRFSPSPIMILPKIGQSNALTKSAEIRSDPYPP